ncbi:aluminum-activated malate transporter 9-like isoform X2 [Solanum dulcamara]|uniref:aluminum-activated malate transporter 9-like isoform X2 n=1 Tax=Solanum dulcamara TaxID=45834 RepID=UPI0024862395|nr:aluminum-activated malate transporter 9-like isoform X2 [Solanum dulcamara]
MIMNLKNFFKKDSSYNKEILLLHDEKRNGCFIYFNNIQDFAKKAIEMGKNDPRKIIFSLKMGFALFFVSLLIFWKEPFPDIAQFSIWAILTVLIMFEFTIGGTLIKGFNRGLGTFCAGMLAFIFVQLALWAGEWERVVCVVSIFIVGCIDGYLNCVECDEAINHSEYNGYKSVIESTSREQTLLGFAIWEPPHGRYKMHKNPWRDFVKLSSELRHCAFMVMALHGCIQSKIQAPPEKRKVFQNELKIVGIDAAKVLRELGTKLEKMEALNSHETILKEVHETAQYLQKKIDQKSYLLVNSKNWEIGKPNIIKNLDDSSNENFPLDFQSLSETAIDIRSLHTNWPQYAKDQLVTKSTLFKKQNQWPSCLSLLDGEKIDTIDEIETYLSASALSLATFASLLIEFVARLQNVVDCFEELSQRAEFKEAISV